MINKKISNDILFTLTTIEQEILEVLETKGYAMTIQEVMISLKNKGKKYAFERIDRNLLSLKNLKIVLDSNELFPRTDKRIKCLYFINPEIIQNDS